MLELLSFIKRFKVYIVFVIALLICLFLIRTNENTKTSPFRSFVILNISKLQELLPVSLNPNQTINVNTSLRELNLKLYSDVVRMKQAEKEYNKLSKMLGFKEKSEYPVIPAAVVGLTEIETRIYATINKGSVDGIKDGMAIRTDAGLVGLVKSHTSNYSIIDIVTNTNVNIAAKTQRNDVRGIVKWQGGNDLIFDKVSAFLDVQVGDVILTSNISNRYPPDIPIGQITIVREDKSSMFYDITVKPYFNINELQEVFVVKYIPNPERQELVNRIEKSLRNR